MTTDGQIQQQQNEQKEGKKTKGCCALAVLFIVTFVVAFFAFAIWNQYKKITSGGIATGILNENIKTIDRQLVETKDDPFWGKPDAPIVIVEFSDFECPFCKQEFPILRELSLKYPDLLKFIYRDFLGHENSQKAAEAAQCANEQDKFLMYHDKLFLNQGNLDVASLKIYARQIGISDINQFDQCLDSGKFELEVKQDYKEGVELGVEGTPTFFVNGIKVAGAIPKERWEQIIEYLIKK